MNFIMTGHKGLIGHFLLERLKAQGHKPILLIDSRDDEDIRDIQKHELKEKVDMFIHLAALCKINKTIAEPELAFEHNVKGTHEVMEFCRKNKIPKVIFTSSSRVISREKNPYTASKIYGEELVKGYADSYGMEYVIIRPSTVYGPFNDLTKRLIDIFILNALQGVELKIFGNGQKTLDFTYIDDFIDGFLIAMQQKNKEFNISSGESVKVTEVADMIIKLAGGGTKNFYNKEIAQPQEVDLDISPLEKLGFKPKINLEEGVKRTFEWYKSHFEEIEKSRQKL